MKKNEKIFDVFEQVIAEAVSSAASNFDVANPDFVTDYFFEGMNEELDKQLKEGNISKDIAEKFRKIVTDYSDEIEAELIELSTELQSVVEERLADIGENIEEQLEIEFPRKNKVLSEKQIAELLNGF